MTLPELAAFHKREIARRKYHLLLLGDEGDWDLKSLEQRGTLHRVSLEDIFGY